MHFINLFVSGSVNTSVTAEVLTVCWFGGFRCVNTKTSMIILEKQLLPINLENLIRSFTNNMNPSV